MFFARKSKLHIMWNSHIFCQANFAIMNDLVKKSRDESLHDVSDKNHMIPSVWKDNVPLIIYIEFSQSGKVGLLNSIFGIRWDDDFVITYPEEVIFGSSGSNFYSRAKCYFLWLNNENMMTNRWFAGLVTKKISEPIFPFFNCVVRLNLFLLKLDIVKSSNVVDLDFLFVSLLISRFFYCLVRLNLFLLKLDIVKRSNVVDLDLLFVSVLISRFFDFLFRLKTLLLKLDIFESSNIVDLDFLFVSVLIFHFLNCLVRLNWQCGQDKQWPVWHVTNFPYLFVFMETP